jgi:hypothetical protein
VSRRATSRPPHLDPPAPAARRTPRSPSLRAAVVKERLAGRHDRLGRTELQSVMRRITAGDPAGLLGLAPFDRVDLGQLHEAAAAVWGWQPDAASVAIDPDRLLAGTAAARDRIVDVGRRGGRVLVATTRPASLLPFHQALARLARGAGAHVLDGGEAGPVAAARRAGVRIWWSGGVAVLTDGDDLLADPGLAAVDELLFSVAHPDLVVADRGFAGGAVRAGIEVVALADLDAVALGLAAVRRRPVSVVPVHERRPPSAYAVLEPLLGAGTGPPEAS